MGDFGARAANHGVVTRIVLTQAYTGVSVQATPSLRPDDVQWLQTRTAPVYTLFASGNPRESDNRLILQYYPSFSPPMHLFV